ncbi:transglutaminase-like domain-containing protein [Fulvivirgaceae bacterium BMA10]|uniref:Transglutaminase-like domain-containing protein n=1 Tax=Splendidivirga corallicola TaxID=3051826 RepID=A0ABT8KVC1_9BACT|nr:transglutaminase-like domain-containing protein [Fulvivirgaceae bacterium BMA10]
MDDKELKALISLLDDEDKEISTHIEEKIISLGDEVIPHLEAQWEQSFNPETQKKIEELIHTLQFESLKQKLISWKASEEQDLLEGMCLVATYQYPDLELSQLKQDIEQIYYEIWPSLKPDIHPFDQVKIFNDIFFGKLKFGANNKNFHAPGNSMINVVLQTKRGNPITLCVIYLLVAQKLEMPVYGVNLPNLFILTYKSKEIQFYINAFNRGLIFTKEDIDRYINELYLTPNDTYYEPCDNLDIIKRALRNLSNAFEKIGDHYKVEELKILLRSIKDFDD